MSRDLNPKVIATVDQIIVEYKYVLAFLPRRSHETKWWCCI